jgi:hypothetical protein
VSSSPRKSPKGRKGDYGSGTATNSATKPRNKNLVIVIVSVIVAVAAVLSAVLIYYSTDYSWSSSIRDHDGDGVADSSDPEPFNANIWAVSTGFINVTLYHNSSEASGFFFGVSSTDLKVYYLADDMVEYVDGHGEEIDSYGNLTLTIPVRWLNGPESVNVTVYVGCDFDWYYTWEWRGSVVVTNAQTATLYLVCPDDFSHGPYY